MTKGFVKELKEMVENKEQLIYINWINIPEYLCRKNPRIGFELREMLKVNGYTVDCENAPQQNWTLEKDNGYHKLVIQGDEEVNYPIPRRKV